VENKTAVLPRTNAKRFPFSSSMVFQTTSIVNAPNKAGKNFIQKTVPPRKNISVDIQDVTGGTDE
jgi:hypothetical protein